MKLHLIRLAKAHGETGFPDIPGFRSHWLREPEAVQEARMYLLLEGEVVIDLPDQTYLHLRRGEAAHLQGSHKIAPIVPSVIAIWTL